jgi:alpha-aminoadipic semialdehyde synthase
VLGIRREDKNKWERRAPLSPDNVRALVAAGVRVLVQPSNIRVYPDAAYAEAGAEVTEDLAPAGTVLAVKEVPPHLLHAGKTYCFFSHTIKGQANNMPLLDALLERRVRLIDYETITAGGVRGGRRLVAFGRYAGIAGMIDFLRGMGERYLGLGFSTPFLNVAATYTYPSLDAAFAAVRVCGEAIARYGLPAALAPLTFVVTGDGNVSKGAQEVLDLLPIAWVRPEELPAVCGAGSAPHAARHGVFGAVATDAHMVRRRATGGAATSPRDAAAAAAAAAAPASAFSIEGEDAEPAAAPHAPDDDAAAPFDKAEYRAHPELYEPVFHTRVLPHTSVLVNCMYWAPQFPRLVTVAQAQAAQRAGALRLMGVCDITCDFAGSVEFLRQFTTIEKPFYVFDVARDALVQTDAMMEAPGVLYHAVDHLPSSLPRDASDHFGACLLPFLPALVASDASQPFAEQRDLPPELRGADICAHGALAPNFEYIVALRAANDRASAGRGLRRTRNESFLTVELCGHLFDSGIVNRVLDLIEDAGASAHILDFKVGKDRSTPTEMRVQLFCPPAAAAAAAAAHHHHAQAGSPPAAGGGGFPALLHEIEELARSVGVELHVTTTAGESGGSSSSGGGSRLAAVPRPLATSSKRVLVLGAGFVSAPLVEYLLRRPANFLTVASVLPEEAQALARSNPTRVTPVACDVAREPEALSALVARHDLVVSLVPAFCHPPVARAAIAHRRHMVTASYVSPELRALHEQAAAAGVVIMNECGLDPGIDHMTAMRMIHAAQGEGGVVTSFSSVCGGLPAPEAANNPLGYKFSWSPRGALAAARNPARYLRGGRLVEVPGEALLTASAPLRVNPAYALEVLPNRDALPYADKYGIAGPQLAGMFRGTLRYGGFSGHMHCLAALGFLEPDARPVPPAGAAGGGVSMRALLASHAGCATEPATDDELLAAVLRSVTAAAGGAVGSTLARLAASASSLAGLASAAVAAAGSAILSTDVARAEELRGFLRWCGFLDAGAPAPLAGAPGAPAAAAAAAAAAATYSPLDTLVAVLTSKAEMSYAPGERDMALMRHELEVAFPGGRVERRTGTLIEYADAKGRTAMARTVGFTAAAAAQMILDGAALVGHHHQHHHQHHPAGPGGAPPAPAPAAGSVGVLVPTSQEWYAPILERLEEEGIRMVERTEVLAPGGTAA